MNSSQAQDGGGPIVGQDGGAHAEPASAARSTSAASAVNLQGSQPASGQAGGGGQGGGGVIVSTAAAEPDGEGGQAAGGAGRETESQGAGQDGGKGAGSLASDSQVIFHNGGMLKPIRTSERARELAERRWAAVKAAARAEVALYGEGSVIQGVRKMTRGQVQLAASGKAGSTSAYSAVLRVADLVERRQAGAGVVGDGVAVNVALGGASAAGLLGLLGKLTRSE